jgi:hypothetical protein
MPLCEAQRQAGVVYRPHKPPQVSTWFQACFGSPSAAKHKEPRQASPCEVQIYARRLLVERPYGLPMASVRRALDGDGCISPANSERCFRATMCRRTAPFSEKQAMLMHARHGKLLYLHTPAAERRGLRSCVQDHAAWRSSTTGKCRRPSR